jgi:outer membrane murein-binding lipoprotein Lpp
MMQALTQLLIRHHESLREHFDRRIDELEQRMRKMSETADTAFAELSAKVDTLGTAVTQFGTDVQAEIAGLSSGPLNPTQQAAKDALSAKIDTLIATVGAMDAGTKPAAPAPTA